MYNARDTLLDDIRNVFKHSNSSKLLLLPFHHSIHFICLQAFRVCVLVCAVMSDIGTAPLQVVGYEGIFGCLAMFCVLLPLVQHTPGQDGSGLHEDSWETWHVCPLLLTPNPQALYRNCPSPPDLQNVRPSLTTP